MQRHVEQAAEFEARRNGKAVAQVALALAQHLVVDGQYQSLESRGMRPLRERLRQAAILVGKHLHPKVAGRFARQILQFHRGTMAHGVNRSGRRRGAGGFDLAARPQHAGHSGRTDQHRPLECLAEQLDSLVATGRAAHRLRQQRQFVEGRFVAADDDFIFGAAVDEIEYRARQAALRKLAQRRNAIGVLFQECTVHDSPLAILLPAHYRIARYTQSNSS